MYIPPHLQVELNKEQEIPPLNCDLQKGGMVVGFQNPQSTSANLR